MGVVGVLGPPLILNRDDLFKFDEDATLLGACREIRRCGVDEIPEDVVVERLSTDPGRPLKTA